MWATVKTIGRSKNSNVEGERKHVSCEPWKGAKSIQKYTKRHIGSIASIGAAMRGKVRPNVLRLVRQEKSATRRSTNEEISWIPSSKNGRPMFSLWIESK